MDQEEINRKVSQQHFEFDRQIDQLAGEAMAIRAVVNLLAKANEDNPTFAALALMLQNQPFPTPEEGMNRDRIITAYYEGLAAVLPEKLRKNKS
ncbi:hypothetical protein HT749_12440 [Burkholderia cepacia]|uniref:hypothetical protein n=1 Tax=Burkholderia cepacia complex TaxID=87882 RepID=UPI000508A84C|nr:MULTISPECIES: hypothetical protein [Burkholderia cepacia complex]KFL51651.1 hypothetical protein JM78_24900 [Burkholderia pyrrocinia]NTX44212.1 hypothetical protein [Burkholderia cepacia]